jgi:hypothetical protein
MDFFKKLTCRNIFPHYFAILANESVPGYIPLQTREWEGAQDLRKTQKLLQKVSDGKRLDQHKLFMYIIVYVYFIFSKSFRSSEYAKNLSAFPRRQ